MTTDTNIDEQLVASALTGDVKAFGRLVERHHGAIVAVAYAITRELATAEDIAQETFCTAWTGLGALREPAAIRPWLCNIARNRSRNALRSQRRITDDEPSTLVDDAASVRDAMVDRETASQVQAALADVPETYREPLVLFYWEGQSIESVAEALAITAAAAQKRISRARTFIKDSLAARLGEVGRSRRTATVAAAAIVAVCSTRQVASAAGAPALTPSTAAKSGVSLTKALAAVAALAVIALTLAVVAGHAPWQSRDTVRVEAPAPPTGSAAIAAPATPSLAARGKGSVASAPAPGSKRREVVRGGFGTPDTYELTVLDPMHVAVNLAGGASGVYLFQPPPPSPPFNRTLRGRVTDDAGRPVAYAVVLVGKEINTSFDSVMADQGAMSGADGTFNVVVHDPDAKTAVALHAKLGWSGRVAVAAGNEEATLAIKIPTPGALVGRVMRGGASIEAAVIVKPLDNNGFDLRFDTDTRGTFELPLLAPGRYRISAGAGQSYEIGAGSSPLATQDVTITTGAPTKLTLDLAVGVLLVTRVRAPAGVKLSTIEYTLVPGSGTFDAKALRTLAREQKARTYLLGGQDAGRDAQFHDVGPGVYTLCVDARPDYDHPWPLVCRAITIAADAQVLEVDVDVKP